MGGHHHDVTGVQAVLLAAKDAADDVAPLYLAAHATAARDIKAGSLLRISDLSGYDADLHDAWRAGRQPA
jgi:uncharacterized protein YcgI (DUF1989 family)